jgi:hypothetical protein
MIKMDKKMEKLYKIVKKMAKVVLMLINQYRMMKMDKRWETLY